MHNTWGILNMFIVDFNQLFLILFFNEFFHWGNVYINRKAGINRTKKNEKKNRGRKSTLSDKLVKILFSQRFPLHTTYTLLSHNKRYLLEASCAKCFAEIGVHPKPIPYNNYFLKYTYLGDFVPEGTWL